MVRLLIGGIAREQAVQPCDRRVGPLHVREGVGEIRDHVGIRHAGADPGAQHRERALRVGLQTMRRRQAEQRRNRGRRERMRALVLLERFVEPALVAQQLAEVVAGIRIRRLHLERAPDGVADRAAGPQTLRQRQVYAGVVGQRAQE